MRPTVQVGDPFTEKLLIEACLELMQTDCIVAIQDMGAAGLTSSSFEMASKGGVGVEMALDAVPARDIGMTAYEFLLSESQERMLMVLKPGSEDAARAVFDIWELDFAVVGHLTDTGRMVMKMEDEIAAALPIAIDPPAGGDGVAAGHLTRKPGVREKAVGEELFLVDLDDQSILRLSAVGAALWLPFARPCR